jgi:hypothetical protein
MTNLKYQVNFDKISKKEQGYIIGLILGDGYQIVYNRQFNTEIYLNSERDNDIEEYVFSLIAKLGLHCQKFKDKKKKSMRLRVSSRSFFETIKDHKLNFREDSITDKDYRLGLISGFIDAEGDISNPTIVVSQKDKSTLDTIARMLNQFEIPTKFYAAKNYVCPGVTWRLKIPPSFKYLPHNSCKVSRNR